MKTQLKYVNFYNNLLLKGFIDGFEADKNNNLHITDCDEACYITPFFDTSDEDCSYNRLVVEGEFNNLRLEVVVAATNDLDVYYNDKPVRLDALLSSKEVSIEEKGRMLCELSHVRAIDTQDIILHSLTGRYVFVYVSVLLKEDAKARIDGITLEFPKYTFTEYLPEIYQGDEFFDRYVAVLQSKYLDIERKIDELERMLDYEKADRDNIIRLSSWLGMDEHSKLFTAEQIRYMIKNLDVFQGGKGTRKTLEEVIKLATGVEAHIVENFQWSRFVGNPTAKKLSMELYGDTRNHFSVILNLSKDTDKLNISEVELEKLIESYSGIGTRFKLICLRKAFHTDTHCYVGVNSHLSTPQTATVDGISLGGYVVVG